MRVLIAPDSFKGTLTAGEAASALSAGLSDSVQQLCAVLLPLGDGGEGTLQAMLTAVGGSVHRVPVKDPLHRTVSATVGMLATGEAFVEMAQASGITLLDEDELDPMRAGSYGTGQLLDAARLRTDRIIIGIGGSATVDGGAGMARALGVRFLDSRGNEIVAGGEGLTEVASVDTSGLHSDWHNIQVKVMCDVDNPLTGPRGAARVFGPQKGAKGDDVRRLECGLQNLAGLLDEMAGRPVSEQPGAGAAGGLGAMLAALLNASLMPGAELALDLAGFDSLLCDSVDLVVTGEGLLDEQTLGGKLPLAVARRCRAVGVPAVAIPGAVDPEAEKKLSAEFAAILPASYPQVPSCLSCPAAKALLSNAARRLGCCLQLSRQDGNENGRVCSER